MSGIAKVIASKGVHSQQYIGQLGHAVHSFTAAGRRYWILRFPAIPPNMEEGLYEDSELVWLSRSDNQQP